MQADEETESVRLNFDFPSINRALSLCDCVLYIVFLFLFFPSNFNFFRF